MALPAEADLYRAARIFKTLAHPHRIALACCLSNGRSATQKELVDELGWPQSTVARHLGELREHGLVHGTRVGNHVMLAIEETVTPQLLAAVCHWVHPDTGEQLSVHLAGAALRESA